MKLCIVIIVKDIRERDKMDLTGWMEMIYQTTNLLKKCSFLTSFAPFIKMQVLL